jgi:hypothetical protein
VSEIIPRRWKRIELLEGRFIKSNYTDTDLKECEILCNMITTGVERIVAHKIYFYKVCGMGSRK